jgi:hypothetical protein
MASRPIVVKHDMTGRVHALHARREAFVVKFRRCALPALQLSQMADVRYSTLQTWLKHRDDAVTPSAASPDGIQSITIGSPMGCGAPGITGRFITSFAM